MKHSPAQLALRQWRAQASNPVALLIPGAVGALLAILGPFDTGQHLTIAPRLAYWLVMVAATYSLGLLINTWFTRALPATGAAPLRVIGAGAVTGLALDQAQSTARDGDRAVLSARGGGDIPVSRANVGAIKGTGLLPQ